jgi:hypothetical protein
VSLRIVVEFQPVYHTTYTSVPTSTPHHVHISSNQYTTPCTRQFQPVYHTMYTSVPTSIPHHVHVSSNQYIAPCTHQFQPVYHTMHTSPTRWIKTHHITASSITPHRLNNFKSKYFRLHPFLTYIYIYIFTLLI